MVPWRYPKNLEPPRCLRKHSGQVWVSPWLILYTTKPNSLKFAASSVSLPAEGSLFCWTCDLCPGGKRPSIYFMVLIQSLGQGGSRAKRSAEPKILKRPRGYFEAFPGNPSRGFGFHAVMALFTWTGWNISADRCWKGSLRLRCPTNFILRWGSRSFQVTAGAFPLALCSTRLGSIWFRLPRC